MTEVTEEAPGKALAVIEGSIVLGPDLTKKDLEAIRDILTGAADYEVPDADADVIAYDQLNRLLFAESEEQLLEEVPTWSSKDSVGQEFRIVENGRLWPSSYVNENGKKGAFLSVQAMSGDGEMGVFNTSSPRIAGKLVWYAQHGMLPAVFRVVQIGQSSKGRPILDIEKTS